MGGVGGVRGSYFLCKHRTFKNSTLFRNVLVAKEGHENVFFFLTI